MSSTPPGWYPEPGARPGHGPPPRRRIPNWAWAAAAVAVSFIIAIGAAVAVFKTGPPIPGDSEASTAADTPVRSETFPELQLPHGTTQRDYKSQEAFDVPLPYTDTVEELRPQLPIGRAYGGLAWCAESHTETESTTWTWGNESDYLTVWISSSPQGTGSEIYIARKPNPTGCLR